MVKNSCNITMRRIKSSGLYTISGTRKGCPRKFKSIRGLQKSTAKRVANARRRLIKKAHKEK